QAFAALTEGDPIAARAAAEEGDSLADAIGDAFVSRSCRWRLGIAQMFEGDLASAVAHFRQVVAEAQADNDVLFAGGALLNQGQALAYHGDTTAARAAANAALDAATELGDIMEGFAHAVLALAGLAAGDVAAAADASEAAWQRLSLRPELTAMNVNPMAEVALARGDVTTGRRWADDFVSATTGWHLASALTTRARVAIAQGEPEQAERDAHDALARAARTGSHQALPDILECLAGLGADRGSYREAARLFGAADAIRQR